MNRNESSTSHVCVPLHKTTTTTNTTEADHAPIAKSHNNIELNATHHHNRPKNRKVSTLLTYDILGGTPPFTSYTLPLILPFKQFYRNIIYSTADRRFLSRLVTRAVTTILNIIV